MAIIDTCKRCANRKFDLKKGIICGFTSEKPDFEVVCDKYTPDESVEEIIRGETRPNTERAKLAYTFVLIVTAIELVSIFSDYFQIKLLKLIESGVQVSEAEAHQNDLRQQIIAFVFLAIYATSIITFLYWFRRAYFNLQQRVSATEFTDGWAVGSWFVPVICLYRPYQIMKEMWHNTVNLNKQIDSDFQDKGTGNTLIYWWSLWIIISYIGNFVIKSSFKTETLTQLINSTYAGIISSLLSIPLGILLYRIIKEYASMEEKLQLSEIKAE